MSGGRLAGKVAIVTGGGSNPGEIGTGRASCEVMAQEGARVLVADIAAENAQRTVDAIVEAGGEASRFVGDATSGDDCRAMVATAVERFGGLHVLMNNLGFRWGGHDRRKGVAEMEEAVLMQAFDLNLKSAVLASKFAIPAMVASGGGSIINVSSIDGIAGARHRGVAYSITKGALPILSRNTAAFHGREGIRANCIVPGHLQSAYQSRIKPEDRELRRRVTPLGTEGTPWDIAWAAVFLASDESRWVTGVTLPVDGGLFAAQPLLAHDLLQEPDLGPLSEDA
ncbi:MAG: SDR family oxidoreductase [Chloroflexi bacterium]|nr:SDR family oxidoreductase [Chloroflexota bacterium]